MTKMMVLERGQHEAGDTSAACRGRSLMALGAVFLVALAQLGTSQAAASPLSADFEQSGDSLTGAASLLRSKPLLSYAIETGCKSLLDNYRELLLLQQQQQQKLQSFGLEPTTIGRLQRVARETTSRTQQRYAEPSLRMLQLGLESANLESDDESEEAGNRLLLTKKAAPKHTPRFGR